MTLNSDECWPLADRLADAAGAAVLPHFRAPGGLETANKAESGFDPVTEADRAAEEAMRAVLARERPQDAVLGEEHGRVAGTSGLTWILDPIDGTRAFICGATSWGTLISVDGGDGPLIGVIAQPYVGERFCGGLGRAELVRGTRRTPLHVRPCARLGDAVMMSTYPEVGTGDERAGFDAVRGHVRLTRYGLDCYAYGLLALGQIDLIIEAGLQIYDVQAPLAVVHAAGGIVTDWRGRPAHRGGRVLAAGDRRIHDAALAILSQVSD